MYWNLEDMEEIEECEELNSNIRCIEIEPPTLQMKLINCWIVTLDVLKYSAYKLIISHFKSWIVTLDVLKYAYLDVDMNVFKSWIVTLDVLKLTPTYICLWIC